MGLMDLLPLFIGVSLFGMFFFFMLGDLDEYKQGGWAGGIYETMMMYPDTKEEAAIKLILILFCPIVAPFTLLVICPVEWLIRICKVWAKLPDNKEQLKHK